MGLVTLECAGQVRGDFADEIGWDFQDVWFYGCAGASGKGAGNLLDDLIPGEDFIAGNMEGLADGGGVACQTGQADSEVARSGEGPWVLALVGHKDWFAQLDAGREIVSRARNRAGYPAVGIGMGGAHDGD